MRRMRGVIFHADMHFVQQQTNRNGTKPDRQRVTPDLWFGDFTGRSVCPVDKQGEFLPAPA
jgi:hypothetical protein